MSLLSSAPLRATARTTTHLTAHAYASKMCSKCSHRQILARPDTTLFHKVKQTVFLLRRQNFAGRPIHIYSFSNDRSKNTNVLSSFVMNSRLPMQTICVAKPHILLKQRRRSHPRSPHQEKNSHSSCKLAKKRSRK